MIIIKIKGGLGNQLFQYAYARALSERFKVPLRLDITNYDGTDTSEENLDMVFKRGYGLQHLNTLGSIATRKEISSFKKFQIRKGRIWFLYNKLIANESKYVEERQFTYNEKYAKTNFFIETSNIYADGYWQSEKYFKDYEDLIRNEFEFKDDPDEINLKIIQEMQKSNSVSLHVRRGNFLIPRYNNHHGICPLNYYTKAIEVMAERVPNPTFFVFSDDMKWVRESIKTQFPITFVDINGPDKDYEDLRLMSKCKNHIIANSSFSWWGAWLAKNKNKVVTYPSQIFKKGWDTSDFAPKEWLKIETKLI